ncbi:MAG: tetratricopeptide repeat protein [Gemmatimonadetes bacterium]|nr:tetratricopeptide repeat protein [Gemmatimonadota bacterium]
MTEPIRRLTAILFTDMVGYTALVQDDEAHARRLRGRWLEVLDREMAAHAGRLLQTYGDGSLSVFESAVAAVRCAVAIQRQLRADPSVPLRIGIHTGDLVHDGDSVFGDGVNVASRIQSLAAPGTVLVSGKVFDEIKNQREFEVIALGDFELKNVRRPVEVFGIVAQGIVTPSRDTLAGPGPTRPSVAVLPFTNMSADAGNEFFSDGVTEELINALTRVAGIQVTARTSSFAFKGQSDDIRTIANRLGVTTVLEGSVRKAGGRVRITAQLIDARTGYHLFSETYDRQIQDIFETQDEIARAIVAAVRERITGEPGPREDAAPAVIPRGPAGPAFDLASRLDRLAEFMPVLTARTDAAVHALYLKGLAEANKWTPDHMRTAVAYYREAIRLDPEYAPAHSGLAGALIMMAALGHAHREETYAQARLAANRAVELDPHDGVAHAGLGMIKLFEARDFDGADADTRRAVELSPGSATARHSRASYLLSVGRPDAAVEEMEKAIELDPLSPVMHTWLARAYVMAHRFDDGIRACENALGLDPVFRSALDELAWNYLVRERYADAERAFARKLEITGDPYKGVAPRGYLAGLMGRRDEAEKALTMLRERQQRNPEQYLGIDFTFLHFVLGQRTEALAWFEDVLQRRIAETLFIPYHPAWRPFRDDPDFRRVLDEHGPASHRRRAATGLPEEQRSPAPADHGDAAQPDAAADQPS